VLYKNSEKGTKLCFIFSVLLNSKKALTVLPLSTLKQLQQDLKAR
jgi:hypothetical protein